MTDAPDHLRLVPFPAPTPQTEAATAALKHALTYMESGDIDSWCFVAIRRDGTCMRCRGWDSASKKWALLGALTNMVQHLSADIDAAIAADVTTTTFE